MSQSVNLLVRVIAWIYDLLLVGIPLAVLSVTLFKFEKSALFCMIILFGCYSCFIPFVTSGFTLGKRLVGIQIVSRGTALQFTSIIIRHIVTGFLYTASLGIVLIISIIMVKARKDRRALHDLFANTAVIFKKK